MDLTPEALAQKQEAEQISKAIGELKVWLEERGVALQAVLRYTQYGIVPDVQVIASPRPEEEGKAE